MRKAADPLSIFPLVAFDFAQAPRIDRTAETSKKKQKASSTPTQAEEPSPPAKKPSKEASPAAEGKPQQKKEKKEKKKDAAATQDSGKKKAAGKAPAADEGEPVPSMIDLRVGHIIDGAYLILRFFSLYSYLRSQETSRRRWFVHRTN